MKDFTGTKVALINNGQVLTMLRDNKPNIDFPGMWDFPGGSREEGETPFQVAKRELKEELGLDIVENEVIWNKVYPAATTPNKEAVFMVIEISNDRIAGVVFGGEGQGWKMADFDDFLNNKNAVPPMQERLKDYLEQST